MPDQTNADDIRILFLAANSVNVERRSLEDEVRQIDASLQAGGPFRNAFKLITRFSVRPQDLTEALLRSRPHIVHFSWPGGEPGGMILDGAEDPKPIASDALLELFKILKDEVRVVVFNGCYADAQARRLSQIIDFTIGMSGLIEDAARVSFSAAFYHALTYDRTVSEAYRLGGAQLMLEQSDSEALFLVRRDGAVDAPFVTSIVRAESHASTMREHVRRLSQIAASDAGFIEKDTHGAFGGPIRLDENFYVHRHIETTIGNLLESDRLSSRFALIVGEAGHGKTSLLWYLYEQFGAEPQWETWFIKATLFLAARKTQLTEPNAWTRFEPSALLEAIKPAGAARPIVLLDTIDLLLRDPTDRDFLIELILALLELKAFVIATCRPQEAVLLSSFDSVTLLLREYDDIELHKAIDKHSQRFYHPAISREQEVDSRRILRAVARGLPIAEVCASPLTLRMLFTVYAPAEIPDDINAFELYRQYWDKRVTQDYRAGTPIPAVESADLSETAMITALGMLAEGTPEPAVQRLRLLLSPQRDHAKELEALISRGVLHASEVGTVSFFHQTFFEHTAARGLLTRYGKGGARLLFERMLSRPYDLFIAAIYEQILLLAETELRANVDLDSAFVELIEHPSLAFQTSAIYVYAHRKTESDRVSAAMEKLLAQAEESLIVRYLSLVPNICEARLPQLFRELDIVWEREKWREHEHLVKLLERLAPRDFESVKAFIARHALLDYLVTRPVGFTGERKLLRVLLIVADYDAEWTRRNLLELYIKAIPQTRSRDLQAAVVEAFCDHASLFGAADLATRVERDTGDLGLDHVRNFATLTAAWSRLISIEWQARARPVSELIEEIDGLSHGLKLTARVQALARVLIERDEDEAATAYQHFKQQVGTARGWLWIKMVWPAMLRGTHDSLKRYVTNESASPSVRYVRREFKRALQDEARELESNGSSAATQLANAVRASVREAKLDGTILLELLDIPQLSADRLWLNSALYASLLGDGFAAGHPGAVLALQSLLREPQESWPPVANIVKTRFSVIAEAGGEALNTLIELILRIRDQTQLLRTLERISAVVPANLRKHRTELKQWREEMLIARSARTRQTGLLIWSHLIRLRLAPAPSVAELLTVFNAESDQRNRGQLITLLGECCKDPDLDVDEVVNFLEPLAVSTDINLRERALAALSRIAARDAHMLILFTGRVVDAALTRPTNAARLSLMRPLLDGLITVDVDKAVEIFVRLIVEARQAGLGINGSRKLLGRLKPMVRRLVRGASVSSRRSLLNVVPKVDRVLGELVVDAVCSQGLEILADEFRELVDADIDSDVKKVVLRYKYSHERTAGGEDWPELYKSLTEGAANETTS
jgi:hypothetical protein